MNAQYRFFWYRRDLRLYDNNGLYHALCGPLPVIPVFIFDTDILDELHNRKDARVEFILKSLDEIHAQLLKIGSSLAVRIGKPVEIWSQLIREFPCDAVYANEDYEPTSIRRDADIAQLLRLHGILFHVFKDHVIFAPNEVLKTQEKPYSVFTPYKRKWLLQQSRHPLEQYPSEKKLSNFFKTIPETLPSLEKIGFQKTHIHFPPKQLNKEIIHNYHKIRDFPSLAGTTRLGIHLRFGTVSIRELVQKALFLNETWLSELIWREFFMMILYHFPSVVTESFRKHYDQIAWNNNEKEFQRWRHGETGYPLVDAGMRELNTTGFMHNRVRMVAASFLAKHLLIDWRWGERVFAEKLLDYDLAANNGNWQWAASTGCDAVPYFRIFNPEAQLKKFDPAQHYVQKWVPEWNTPSYCKPIVNHTFARARALLVYKSAIQ